MSEPKRYFAYDKAIAEDRAFERDVELFRADNPVLAEWKRKADALNKLEEMARSANGMLVTMFSEGNGDIRLINVRNERRAPSLLEAIEKARDGE